LPHPAPGTLPAKFGPGSPQPAATRQPKEGNQGNRPGAQSIAQRVPSPPGSESRLQP